MTAPETRAACGAEEASLVLDRLTAADALAIGLTILGLAPQRYTRPVAIHLETDGYPLFTHFMEGTGAENLAWINRKKNVVRKFGRSSWAVRVDYLERGLDFQTETGLDPEYFRAEGGAVPLVVRGFGRVGILIVSGLDGCDDHALAVEGLLKWKTGD